MNFSKLIHYPIKSVKTFCKRCVFKFLSFRFIPDKLCVKIDYRINMHRKLNIKDPQTFNEKLNWLKLYHRKPIMTDMVDKYNVKEYVSSLIGSEYVIKPIAVYDKWKDIDFTQLKTPYVLKTTHSSGMVKVIRNADEVDFKLLKKKVNKSLRHNYFYLWREWPYKNVKPRIIIEEFVEDHKEVNLPVYKFFCFDGNPYLVQTIKNDKTSYETIDYFDMNWNKLDLRQNFPNSEKCLEKPGNFEEMKVIAKKLSQGFPFIRVDLYSVDGKVYFSEFTFFSDAGNERFYPDSWDLKLGQMINLEKYE